MYLRVQWKWKGCTTLFWPKIQSELKDLAAGLNQTVDYGWLWPIAKLLFLGLQFFHNLVGNWDGQLSY